MTKAVYRRLHIRGSELPHMISTQPRKGGTFATPCFTSEEADTREVWSLTQGHIATLQGTELLDLIQATL